MQILKVSSTSLVIFTIFAPGNHWSQT